jgi:hypothetical protein
MTYYFQIIVVGYKSNPSSYDDGVEDISIDEFGSGTFISEVEMTPSFRQFC